MRWANQPFYTVLLDLNTAWNDSYSFAAIEMLARCSPAWQHYSTCNHTNQSQISHSNAGKRDS